jgi:hypothetical protein
MWDKFHAYRYTTALLACGAIDEVITALETWACEEKDHA